ncbi:MAG: hypothetical protein KDI09_04940 [Halioglobus sp.]|nr:hypothetical protein [Halioglobus sp.]
MKTYDLTFNGSVLPGHSPCQVRHNLAHLFCIENDSVVKELFSGETIYLRCDLDRKTAAGYFREITELGGEATLVASSQRLGRRSGAVALLKLEPGKSPRIVRETDSGMQADKGSDRLWPVSSARIVGNNTSARPEEAPQQVSEPSGVSLAMSPANDEASIPEKRPGTTKQPNSSPSTPDGPAFRATRAQLILTSTGKELARLQAQAAQTREESIREVSKLRRCQSRLADKAASDIAEIQQLRRRLEETTEAEIEHLEAQEKAARAEAATELDRLAHEEREQLDAAERALAQLSAETEGEHIGAQNRIQELEARAVQTRATADEEIARLQALLETTRRRADENLAAIQHEMDILRAESDQAVKRIKETNTTAHTAAKAAINTLQAERENLLSDLESHTGELFEKQQSVRESMLAELAALDLKEQEINQACERNELSMENAYAELRKRTEESLLKLKELEDMLKGRQKIALEELANTKTAQHSVPVSRPALS